MITKHTIIDLMKERRDQIKEMGEFLKLYPEKATINHTEWEPVRSSDMCDIIKYWIMNEYKRDLEILDNLGWVYTKNTTSPVEFKDAIQVSEEIVNIKDYMINKYIEQLNTLKADLEAINRS